MAGLIGPLKTSLVARVSMHEGGTAWGNKRTAGEAGKQLLFQFRPLSVVVVDSSFASRLPSLPLLAPQASLPESAGVHGRWMVGGCSWRIVIGREKCTSMGPRPPRCGQSAKWTASHGFGGSRRPVGFGLGARIAELQGLKGVLLWKVANVNGGYVSVSYRGWRGCTSSLIAAARATSGRPMQARRECGVFWGTVAFLSS